MNTCLSCGKEFIKKTEFDSDVCPTCLGIENNYLYNGCVFMQLKKSHIDPGTHIYCKRLKKWSLSYGLSKRYYLP